MSVPLSLLLLMAMWFKALPLTASYLSPLPPVQLSARACEKGGSDLIRWWFFSLGT